MTEFSPLCVVCFGLLSYVVASVAYNIFLHPLRAYPGPFLWRATRITKAYHFLKGDLPFVVKTFHDKYGPVVRLTPGELAFADVQAYKDIYGQRAGGYLPKWQGMYGFKPDNASDILLSNGTEHSFLRRQLANGFTDKAMRAQEPLIAGYVNLLIRRLHETCAARGEAAPPQDMTNWFTWFSFDIIGNLALGSDFGGLQEAKSASWVALVIENVRMNAFAGALLGLNPALFRRFLVWVMTGGVVPAIREHERKTREKMRQRLDFKGERLDLIEGLVKKQAELGPARIESNATVLILAGSETTSSALSGILFALLKNPDKLARLTKEVRSAFRSDSDITLDSVQRLPYLLACINEGLRWYPPAMHGFPREVTKGGVVISGHHIPEHTIVAAWQWSVSRCPEYYIEPDNFHPERFMENVEIKFSGDRLDAVQPFSLGPRNCIGKNLAYTEMRLVISRLVYDFDMELDKSSENWLKGQPAYHVWDKRPLMVTMTPASR